MSGTKKWLASDGVTELHPFDKVLMRDEPGHLWVAAWFSYCDFENESFPFCAGGQCWTYCIPYEGNESLAGTRAPIPEPRQDTDKPLEWGERVHVWHDDLDFKRIAIFCKLDSGAVPYGVLVRGGDTVSYWRYCERA